MAQEPFEPSVLISYKQLDKLLEASREVQKLRYDVKRLSDQQQMLRGLFLDLMEEFKKIK